MDFTHYNATCVRAAADLVNTQGSVSGNEFMGTAEEVRAFLEGHDFTAPDDITQEDIACLHEVRDRLRAVFHADDAAEAAARLNALLADLDARPYLTDHDGHWHVHYAPLEAPIGRQVGAAVAAALAVVLAEHGLDRLGICSADDCADVYVDVSRNHSRRYCNDLCSSRMNVAAYRARRGKTTSSS